MLGQGADGLAQIAFAQVVVFELEGGASPAEIVRLLAATLLPFSVIGPFAGVIVDRWDRRRVLVVASLTRAALVMLAMSVLVTQSKPLAYLGMILLLSVSRFVLAAKGAALPRTVPRPADLVDANSLSSVAGLSAGFLGAVVGSTFVAVAPAAGFVIAALAYLVAAQRFAGLPPVGGGESETPVGAGLARVGRELLDGLSLIVSDRDIHVPLLAVWGHRLLLGGAFVVLVMIADLRYGFEAPGYGMAIAVIGVGAFVGTIAAPAAAARFGASAVLPAAYLLAGAVAVVCGFWPNLAPLVAGIGVVAAAFQVLKVVADAMVQRATPDPFRGRVFAVYDMLYNTAFVVAALAMVPLWALGREQRLLWGVAAAFVAAGFALARATRSWPWGAGRSRTRTPATSSWPSRLAALFAGTLPTLAFPEPGWWPLAFVGLVPLVILVQRAPTWRAAGSRAWWGGVGYFVVTYHWLVPTTGPFVAALAALLALSWVPWGVVARWAIRSSRPVAASVLLVPAAWVTGEFVRSWEALGGPWGLLGASQTEVPRVLHVAAVGGVWAVSALLVVVNVGIATGVTAALPGPILGDGAAGAAPRAGPVRAAAATGVVVAAAVASGVFAVPSVNTEAPTVRVAGAQPGTGFAPAARFDVQESASRSLKAMDPDLVVWGESSVGVDLASEPEYEQRLIDLAAEIGAPVLVNVDARQATGGIRKTAVLVGPDGVLGSYDKMRLVPFGEYVPFRQAIGWVRRFSEAAEENRGRGEELVVMEVDGLRLGPLVCFESTFPDLTRELARRDVDMVIVQAATTTFQDSWAPEQHSSLAVVRAVESGRPVVHATLTGETTVVDRAGERLVVMGTDERGTWHAAVPLDLRTTPYVLLGDWVPAISIALLVLAAMARTLASQDPRDRASPATSDPADGSIGPSPLTDGPGEGRDS
jgi:apolipoprotein N-acyltransferase